MASIGKRHRELVDGEGLCSVPMWCDGMPAGFCDAPAYGTPEAGQERYGEYINGKWSEAYIPALACYAHGGPRSATLPAEAGKREEEEER